LYSVIYNRREAMKKEAQMEKREELDGKNSQAKDKLALNKEVVKVMRTAKTGLRAGPDFRCSIV
jgi:hypothetical protein